MFGSFFHFILQLLLRLFTQKRLNAPDNITVSIKE